MSVMIADCPCCKNCFDRSDITNPLCCNAFPEGIPKEYLWGDINVKNLEECKNGYKYEEQLS